MVRVLFVNDIKSQVRQSGQPGKTKQAMGGWVSQKGRGKEVKCFWIERQELNRGKDAIGNSFTKHKEAARNAMRAVFGSSVSE